MTIRFSVLLPTKNRLDLLQEAVETVRNQSSSNWEIVVADNCSSDDVAGYIRGLADTRIKFVRSDVPLSVTDNWNRALEAATGDYVVMLGDDDGLVPRYFERMSHAISELRGPDMIYHGAYHFAHPGVMPGRPEGALTDVTLFHEVLRDCPPVSLLPKSHARSAALAAIDLRAVYGFNMQYFLFSRRLIVKLKQYGSVFQGPFPDFYAANQALLVADSIGRVVEPMVVIGISPKSYGFFHFNRNEKTGADFLAIEKFLSGNQLGLAQTLLPGSIMNTSWLLSVALVKASHADDTDIRLGVSRYRRLQIVHCLAERMRGKVEAPDLVALWPLLRWHERAYSAAVHSALRLSRTMPQVIAKRIEQIIVMSNRQYLRPPTRAGRVIVGRYKSMTEVFEGLSHDLTGSDTRGNS